MNPLLGPRRKTPLGRLLASPGQHDFAGCITAPHALVDRSVQAAIVAGFQRVHHHQGDAASILTLIPGLAAFLFTPAGALGLTSMARTPTGMRFVVSFAPPFVEFGLGGHWRRFAIDLDDEDIAIVAWG